MLFDLVFIIFIVNYFLYFNSYLFFRINIKSKKRYIHILIIMNGKLHSYYASGSADVVKTSINRKHQQNLK